MTHFSPLMPNFNIKYKFLPKTVIFISFLRFCAGDTLQVMPCSGHSKNKGLQLKLRAHLAPALKAVPTKKARAKKVSLSQFYR